MLFMLRYRTSREIALGAKIAAVLPDLLFAAHFISNLMAIAPVFAFTELPPNSPHERLSRSRPTGRDAHYAACRNVVR